MARENTYRPPSITPDKQPRVVVWKLLLGLAGIIGGSWFMAGGLGKATPPLKRFTTVIWLLILGSFITLIAVLVIIEKHRPRKNAKKE